MDSKFLPSVNTHRFDNNLRIVTIDVPNSKLASISVFVGIGSRYEDEDQSGISHFIEHILFKGTKSRPNPWDIASAIESVGGVLNASTEQEMTTYWSKVPQRHLYSSIDLIFDMLRNSRFEKIGIDKERLVICEELNMIYDNPENRVEYLMDKLLWPNHPLGNEIAGTKNTVMNMTIDEMIQFKNNNYIPNNIVISIAGKLSHNKIVSYIEELNKDWFNSDDISKYKDVSITQAKPAFNLEYRKTEQSHMIMALPGLSIKDLQKYSLDLISIYLAGGMSSKLFVELREKHGLVYDVNSYTINFLDTGALFVAAGSDPTKSTEVVKRVLSHLWQLQNGISESNLAILKKSLIGRILLRIEDTLALSYWYGAGELFLKNSKSPEQIISYIDNINLTDVNNVIKSIIDINKINLAIVGPDTNNKVFNKILNFNGNIDLI